MHEGAHKPVRRGWFVVCAGPLGAGDGGHRCRQPCKARRVVGTVEHRQPPRLVRLVYGHEAGHDLLGGHGLEHERRRQPPEAHVAAEPHARGETLRRRQADQGDNTLGGGESDGGHRPRRKGRRVRVELPFVPQLRRGKGSGACGGQTERKNVVDRASGAGGHDVQGTQRRMVEAERMRLRAGPGGRSPPRPRRRRAVARLGPQDNAARVIPGAAWLPVSVQDDHRSRHASSPRAGLSRQRARAAVLITTGLPARGGLTHRWTGSLSSVDSSGRRRPARAGTDLQCVSDKGTVPWPGPARGARPSARRIRSTTEPTTFSNAAWVLVRRSLACVMRRRNAVEDAPRS